MSTPEEKGGVLIFMKTITRRTSRTVQAKTAAEFDEAFDRASREAGDSYELVWDTAPMTVHFIIEEHVKVAETAADELSLQGIHLKCRDCPHREQNPDGRKAGKRDFCPFALMQETRADKNACEYFCSQVLRGEEKPLEE